MQGTSVVVRSIILMSCIMLSLVAVGEAVETCAERRSIPGNFTAADVSDKSAAAQLKPVPSFKECYLVKDTTTFYVYIVIDGKLIKCQAEIPSPYCQGKCWSSHNVHIFSTGLDEKSCECCTAVKVTNVLRHVKMECDDCNDICLNYTFREAIKCGCK